MQSAAMILSSPEFLQAGEDTRRYIHHKFQDFGYRMAHDLGDLGHRSIYMRLAKTEDKFLLEQALSFAVDYGEDTNKGRIFMWKLQQLRRARELEAARRNFEHDFIMARMQSVQVQLATHLHARHLQQFNQTRQNVLNAFAAEALKVPKGKQKLTKAIDLGAATGVDSAYLAKLGIRLTAIELSAKLVDTVKKTLPAPHTAVRKSTYLDTGITKLQPHAVWIGRMWNTVPEQHIPLYANFLKQTVAPKGILGIAAKCGDAPQSWREFTVQERPELWFERPQDPERLSVFLEAAGFESVLVEFDGDTMYTLWRHS